jgi:micrococcal nuclease
MRGPLDMLLPGCQQPASRTSRMTCRGRSTRENRRFFHGWFFPGLLCCVSLLSADAAEPLPPLPAVSAVPAAPQVVIQGGELPKNWTPAPVACSGVGPDGRAIVVHVAPTYVFTLAAGPPVAVASPAAGVTAARPAATDVLATRTVTQTVAMRPSVPYGSNWVFQTQGNLPPDSAGLLAKRAEPPAAPPSTWAQAAPALVMAAPAAAAISSLPPPPQSWQPVQVPPPQPQVLASIPTPQESPAPPIVPIPFVPPQPTAGTAIAQPTGRGSTVAPRTWRVVGVQDGDTLTCLDESGGQQKVRLAGIDAPEIGQDFGRQSRDALADLVFGRAVEVLEEGRDRQGRTIAKLLVDGDDVNRRMVATGMAWHYSAYSTDPDLDGLEAEAREARKGLWSQPSPVAPWDYRRNAAAGRTVASRQCGHPRPTA